MAKTGELSPAREAFDVVETTSFILIDDSLQDRITGGHLDDHTRAGKKHHTERNKGRSRSSSSSRQSSTNSPETPVLIMIFSPGVV
jgi:hypothetical protein